MSSQWTDEPVNPAYYMVAENARNAGKWHHRAFGAAAMLVVVVLAFMVAPAHVTFGDRPKASVPAVKPKQSNDQLLNRSPADQPVNDPCDASFAAMDKLFKAAGQTPLGMTCDPQGKITLDPRQLTS